MVTCNHMPLRRVILELASKPLVDAGFVPASFFRHNESIEILHIYAFEPRERMLLVRVLRSGKALSEKEVQRQRESLRRRYHLRDFEILQVADDGRTYVALLRQENPGILEALLEELGVGLTPTTPTVLGKETATLSFISDAASEKRVFALLDSLRIPWRIRSRGTVRAGRGVDSTLTVRQREILSLAWNLGYFDIPARVGLQRLSNLTGLSRNSVSQHLRRGLRRLLSASL